MKDLLPPNDRHFAALDGLRGICAILVAFFHISIITDSIVVPISFVFHSYLFVDFFFILSGFVISGNFANDIRNGFGLGRFLLLRLGRLYPLHAVTLAFLVGLALVATALLPSNSHIEDVWPWRGNDISAFYNVAMMQGFIGKISWNYPSWSISVEFAVYVLFAVACFYLASTMIVIVAALALIAIPVFIFFAIPSSSPMDLTADLGILRGLIGFAGGIIAYAVQVRLTSGGFLGNFRAPFTHLLEGFAVILVIATPSLAYNRIVEVCTPFVFIVVVVIFSLEGGIFSRALRFKAMWRLGILSYSIYMIHVPIIALYQVSKALLADSSHAGAVPATISAIVASVAQSGVDPGSIAAITLLVIVVLVAPLSYAVVEKPARQWSRRAIEKYLPASMKARSQARALGGADNPALPPF